MQVNLEHNKLIQSYKTLVPNGYNLCTGGLGGHGLFGERNGAYGRSGPLNPNWGKRPLNADRPVTAETRAKMSASHKGQKRTEEQRKNKSEAKKKYWAKEGVKEKMTTAIRAGWAAKKELS